MREALDKFEWFLDDDTLPALIQCGLAHASLKLTTAHSFCETVRAAGPEFKGTVIELKRADDRIQTLKHLEGYADTIRTTGGALTTTLLPSGRSILCHDYISFYLHLVKYYIHFRGV